MPKAVMPAGTKIKPNPAEIITKPTAWIMDENKILLIQKTVESKAQVRFEKLLPYQMQ
jgi:hypothetical protein